MSASGGAVPPLDATLYREWKYQTGKNLIVVRSSSALVSLAASALLVWILFRSRHGMNTTYHRLLLGLSVADILFSLSYATFGAVVPGELNYVVWNARGNQASCDALGFLHAVGAFGGIVYMCSLNLYYLAKVRFNKSDTYIAKKLEMWLHLVPVLFGLCVGVVFVAKEGMNASIYGVCTAADTYEPPHCNGYQDGEIPEGFEIPCGRGRSVAFISYVTGFITVFLAPMTIGISLWTIYSSVSRAEQRIARYGAGGIQRRMSLNGSGALRSDLSQSAINDAATTDVEGGGNGGGGAFAIVSSVSSRFGGWATRTNSNISSQESAQSRAVLHKAAAYSVAYFVTWIWTIVYGVLYLAGAWTFDLPQPTWQVAYWYAYVVFTPLQGLWTLLIYVQPSVVKRKRQSSSADDGGISWWGAFADVLRSAAVGGGGDDSAGRGRSRSRSGGGAPRTAASGGRPGTNPSRAPSSMGGSASAADRHIVCAPLGSAGLKAEDVEEEKREIQENQPSA